MYSIFKVEWDLILIYSFSLEFSLLFKHFIIVQYTAKSFHSADK